MKIPLVLCTVLLCLSSNSVMSQATVKGEQDFIKDAKENVLVSPNLFASLIVEEQRNQGIAVTRMSPISLIALGTAVVHGVGNSSASSTPMVEQDQLGSDSDDDDSDMFIRSLSQSFTQPVNDSLPVAGLSITPSTGCLVDLLGQTLKVKAPCVPHTSTPPSPFVKRRAPAQGVASITVHMEPVANDHQSNTPSPIRKPSPDKK